MTKATTTFDAQWQEDFLGEEDLARVLKVKAHYNVL